ncbi:MAG: DUF2062 domain-containing protein [Patescibacteria group bacterium]
MIKKIKDFSKRFFLINDTPHKVAAGAALGVFLGIMPGEGVATTLVLASVLKFNRLAATAGVLATNIWGTFLALPPAAAAGGFLFGESPKKLIEEFQSTYHLGLKFFFSKAVLLDIALPLVIGFFIVVGVIALAVYLLLIFYLVKYKKEQHVLESGSEKITI